MQMHGIDEMVITINPMTKTARRARILIPLGLHVSHTRKWQTYLWVVLEGLVVSPVEEGHLGLVLCARVSAGNCYGVAADAPKPAFASVWCGSLRIQSSLSRLMIRFCDWKV